MPKTGTTLTDRIRRHSIDDQIYLGTIVENATGGEFGDLLRVLINGIYDDQLAESQMKTGIPSDRFLGRMEALKILQDRLILMVDLKERLTEEKREEQKV
jgi:hypothetical protein